MNQLTPDNINRFLYCHQIPKDMKTFVQSFILCEIANEEKMNQENSKENRVSRGRTYSIYKVIFTMVEYVKFIVLNNSRGNYDLKRGFEFQPQMVQQTQDYMLYLNYIFNTLGIPFDALKIKENLETKGESGNINNGDIRFRNLIYEPIENYVFNQIGELKDKKWIFMGTNSLQLTNYPSQICSYLNIQKNGKEAYRDVLPETKKIYHFYQELIEMRSVRHCLKDKQYQKYLEQLKDYYELWYSTKYVRAQKRGANNNKDSELLEIENAYHHFEIEFQKFRRGFGDFTDNSYINLPERKEQFIKKENELIDC